MLSHCGEGRRHLGETVGSRCGGVARAVAPLTRWCHLGRVGAEVILQGLVALSLMLWGATLSGDGDASRAGQAALVRSTAAPWTSLRGRIAPNAVNLPAPLFGPARAHHPLKLRGSRWTPQSAAQSVPHSHSCVERAQASVLVDGQMAALCSAACEGFR